MIKQQWLAFLEPECLESLWEQFPVQARDKVTAQYARLKARTSVLQWHRFELLEETTNWR